MSTEVLSPFPLFTTRIGVPLTAGYVYIGVENQDPETHPQQVYWDIGLATPAVQPLRTDGGYIVNGGNPSNVYTDGAFSIRVRDRFGLQVFYRASVPNADALRDELASAAGAGLIGFSHAQTYPAGTLGAKGKDTVSVKDAPYNAKGDGTTDDTAAIQAAITACGGQNGKTVHFPAGNYYITAPITVPNYTHIIGDGPYKSRINLEGKAYTGHIFTNADAVTFGWLTIENFGFRAGSYGILNQSASQENWILNNVVFEIQTVAGIGAVTNWQLNQLKNVTFYYCVRGVSVGAGFANMNNYLGCEFNGLDREAFVAVGGSCEVNNFVGCRFEAGGVSGRTTIELVNAQNTSFDGCYFENTHPKLLHQAGGAGTVFDNCHFTQAIGPVDYVFDSNVPVLFGTNSWGRKSDGPTRMRVSGDNGSKLGKNNAIYNHQSRQSQDLVGPATALGIGTTNINTVTLTREFTAASLADSSTLYGVLTVIVQEVLTGGFSGRLIVEIPVFAEIIGSGAFVITYGTQVVVSDTTGAVVTITTTTTGTATVTASVLSVPGTLANGFVTWAWRSVSGAVPGYYAIAADFT